MTRLVQALSQGEPWLEAWVSNPEQSVEPGDLQGGTLRTVAYIDTGSTQTHIHCGLLAGIKNHPLGSSPNPVSTGNGMRQSMRHRVGLRLVANEGEIFLPQIEVIDYDVTSMHEARKNIQVLIGLDILSRCRFYCDFTRTKRFIMRFGDDAATNVLASSVMPH